MVRRVGVFLEPITTGIFFFASCVCLKAYGHVGYLSFRHRPACFDTSSAIASLSKRRADVIAEVQWRFAVAKGAVLRMVPGSECPVAMSNLPFQLRK